MRLTSRMKDQLIHDLWRRSTPYQQFKEFEEVTKLEFGRKLIDKFLGTHREAWENLPKKFKYSEYEIYIENVPGRWRVDFPVAEKGKQTLVPKRNFLFGDFSKTIQKEINEIGARQEKLWDERFKFKQKLEAVIKGCNTDQQFLNYFPEYDSLLPQAVKNQMIVSQETINEIKSEIAVEEDKEAA